MSFSATVEDWVNKVEGASEAILKESAQELAEEADGLLVDLIYRAPVSPSGYRRTGFLRSSLMASTSQMPAINPAAQPAESGSYTFQPAEITAVIAGAELGRPIFMGYVAGYAGHVHYGSRGKPGRPWVDLAAQRWPAIVDRKAEELKSRLGL